MACPTLKQAAAGCALAAALMIPACASAPDETAVAPEAPEVTPTYDRPAAAPASKTFVRHFLNGHDPKTWHVSDYDLETPVQKTAFRPSQTTFDEAGLTLTLAPRDRDDAAYLSGEYQKNGRYGFGRYEAIMRPATGSGLASNFFIYTDFNDGRPNEEVGVQFLGKDTNKVHFSYVTAGERGPGFAYTLPFDAAEADHLYAFERTAETIRWYVDDELVHELPADAAAPQSSARIILNLWAGEPSITDWVGPVELAGEAKTLVRCVSFADPGDETNSCSSAFTD